MNKQNGFANVAVIIAIIAVVAIGGYFVFANKSTQSNVTNQVKPSPGIKLSLHSSGSLRVGSEVTIQLILTPIGEEFLTTPPASVTFSLPDSFEIVSGLKEQNIAFSDFNPKTVELKVKPRQEGSFQIRATVKQQNSGTFWQTLAINITQNQAVINQKTTNIVMSKPFISPSIKNISSDQEIKFTFSAPKEAKQSKVYISCESGLFAYFSDNLTPRSTPQNICNTWRENILNTTKTGSGLVSEIRAIKIKNNTTKGKIATLQMTVTMPDNSSLKSDIVSITINEGLASVDNEPAIWNSYRYSSAESGILPDLAFGYPAFFGNPTLISSRVTNRPEFISDDWGGLVQFSPTGALGSGLLMTFFKKINTENSFENYVVKTATSGGYAAPKYFQVGQQKAARIRFASSSHYDGDVGWYFIELTDKNILAISTDGNKEYLFDDDQSGNSTTDKIISTFVIGQYPLTCTVIDGGSAGSTTNWNVVIESPVTFSASGGNSSYNWSAPDGRPSSGTGNQFITTFSSSQSFIVTVTSGIVSSTCKVSVWMRFP